MGRIPVPCDSARTTTGIFVTGSIISARILTSSSMVASDDSVNLLANQTIRRRPRDSHLSVFSQKLFTRRSEIYNSIAGGAPRPLTTRGVVRVYQNFIL